MKRFLLLLFLVIVFGIIAITSKAQEIDYSRPFPLSLLNYSSGGGEFNPWPLDVLNVQINTDSTTQLQNEEMVAINPLNTSNAVALWRDFRLGFRRIGVGYTFDGGQTWHDTLLYVPPYPWQSDPVLAVDSAGNFFACSLCLRSTGRGPTGIYIQKSTDGGISWADPVIAVDSASAYFEDKQWMTIDNNPGANFGNIYISWARFTADLSSSRIAFVASRDRGETYSDPIWVSDAEGVQWPVPAVGTNGEVYVAWFQYFPTGIFFDKSLDQGMTFGADRRIVTASTFPGNINGGILVFPFPAMTCDIAPASPFNGNVYIAYMDMNSADMDIFFIRSEDQGATWSTRVKINDDDLHNGADQFHPWISVDDAGIIHAIFYDRRLDVVNNMLFDLYYSRSGDGGLTWTPNERITTVSSDPRHAALAGLIGEYIGLSAWMEQVQMVWTDTRNGNQDVFAGRMDITGVNGGISDLPLDFALGDPYPNPFNSSVAISFSLTKQSDIALDIYDVLGQRICRLLDGVQGPGQYRVNWDGIDQRGGGMASGPYFIQLRAAGATVAKKALLIR